MKQTTRDNATATTEWRTFLAATSNAVMPCVDGGSEWTSEDRRQQERAAALCGGCQAVVECAAYAFAVEERHGVLGGLTEAQRKRRRRRRRNAA